MEDSQSGSKSSGVWCRYLQPGESVLAAFAISLALVLLLTTVISIWWATRTEQRVAVAARQRQVEIVGQLLVSNIQSMLQANEASHIRRFVINAAHEYDLSACRVITGDGKVIADVDPRNITIDSLELNELPLAEADFVFETENGSIKYEYPILLSGKSIARLEIKAPRPAIEASSWTVPTSVGVGGLIVLSMLLVLYRRVRSQLRATSMIKETLATLSHDDTCVTTLRLSSNMGEEAVAWNGLLDQIQNLREQTLDRRAYGALRAVNENSGDLHIACDAMADGLLLLNPEMKISYANGASAVFLGQPHKQLPGMLLPDLVEDPRITHAAQQVLNNASSVRGVVEVDRRKDGAEGVLRFIARPVRKGDTAAIMVIIEDITQMRIAQESHSAFLAQAAHELRTPLTNIRLHLETAIEEGDKDPVMRAECLNVINSESTRLERIVNDMLSVAEIEAGALMLIQDDIQLEAILKQLEKDHSAHARAKKQTLTFHLPPKLPLLRGDQDKILLALHNILGNAIKYTPEGGSISLEIEVREEQVVINMIDTGYGISQEDIPRVFNKFFRAGDKRVREVIGSGLGLGLAREVVRMHGGELSLESEIDKGSTFSMTLPIKEQVAA